MSARFVVVWATALAGTWALAGPAAALPPGVHVDPGSPAGKEYTAPLSALRGEASGHLGGRDQTEPLFGIGITPAGASVGSASPATQSGGSSGRSAAGGAAHGSRGANRGGPGNRTPVPVSASITDHGSATPSVLLLAGLVLLGGLGLGGLALLARRRLE